MNAADWKTKLRRCLAVVAGWGVAGGPVVAAPAPRLELSRRDSGWFLEYVPSPRAGEVTLHYASELADLWSTKVRVVEVPADSGPLVIEVTDLVRGPRGFFGVTESGDPVLPGGFVLIPGGTFQMGDTFAEGNDDERPVHPVHVSAFFLQARETTKAEWDEVHTWALAHGYTFDNPGLGKGADHPVHSVSWYDVVKWCNARSQKEGLEPCYYTDAARTRVYKTGQVDVTNAQVLWTANGYRLPTEAEWEKAARGGLSGQRFPWGDTITHSLANYVSRSHYAYDLSPTHGYHPLYHSGSQPYTSPVGSFASNGYGLYDMTGNVWEWCWDWFGGAYYSSGASNDPRGPSSGSYRVNRGGSWSDPVIVGRVTYRYWSVRSAGFNVNGFRPARGR